MADSHVAQVKGCLSYGQGVIQDQQSCLTAQAGGQVMAP